MPSGPGPRGASAVKGGGATPGLSGGASRHSSPSMDLGRITTAALLLAVLVAVLAASRGEAPRGLHVSGDLADRLPRGDAPSAEAARVEVVALSGWSKLRHVPGGPGLCGGPCQGVPGPRVVRVIDLHPRGARKVVLIRLGERAGVAPAGPEALPCARAILAAETARLLGAPPPCGGGEVTRWRLPLGLGYLTRSRAGSSAATTPASSSAGAPPSSAAASAAAAGAVWKP